MCIRDRCDTVYLAFSMIDIEMDQRAMEAEDNIRWVDIIIQALEQLGGRATLAEIYEECKDLIALFHPDKFSNATIAVSYTHLDVYKRQAQHQDGKNYRK